MKKRNKGFVLTELLLTLGIVAASLSVVGVAANDVKTSLDQTQAESNARILYEYAQQNITKLRASGYDLENRTSLSYNPENYLGNPLKIVKNSDSDADVFGNPELGGSWLIEYDSVYGIVYGAFWSNGSLSFYTGTSADQAYREADLDTFVKYSKQYGYNFSYYGAESLDCTPPVSKPGPEEEEEPDPIPEEPTVPTGFCYYEIYANDNDPTTDEYGYYLFSSAEDKLQNRIVIGDGYGVIMDSEKAKSVSSVSVSGTKSIALSNCSAYFIDGGYIYQFPTSWMTVATNTKPVYNQDYYWTISIDFGGLKNNENWSYSPYYAKSAVTYTTSKILPAEVYIRSPRQLYSLSQLYPSYYNKKWAWSWTEERVANTTFVQELNLDYSAYLWNVYAENEYADGQTPIGTDWGGFISDYDGKGNTIYNIQLAKKNRSTSEYTYAGLFGYVYRGTIKNVHIDGGNREIKDANYCGILAAYVQNATVINSSVANYTLNYATKASTTYTSPNEFAYVRMGAFIGYVKCPQEDNSSWYTTIDNCSVVNCTVKANNYLSQSTGDRCYNIGGFVGSVADRESNQSRANHVTISNCSVQGTMATNSYGKMAWYNIGGFAGAIKKYVNISNITTNVSDAKSSNHYATYYES